MLVVAINGREELLENFLDKTISVRLYTNNMTPDSDGDNTSADFTECAVAGYATETLAGTDWTITDDAAGLTEADATALDFTPTAATTCYGYFCTYNDGVDADALLWSERFSTPAVIGAGGGTISVTPHFDSSSRTA